MPTSQTFRTASVIILLGGFFVLLLIENLRPLRSRRRPRLGRYVTNVGMTALGLVAGALAVRPVGLGLASLSASKSFGLLYWTPFPVWLRFVFGFLMMDLSFYYWHRLNHVIPILWRFHSVHHIDPDMDVTTSLRFHFGEVFLSAFFRAVQVLAIGIAPLTYVIYELFFSLATLFHHSNIRIGLDLEKRLNRVIVTPRMHGIHHSVVRSELNSNYSVIFRCWDTLNRSLVLNVPQSAIKIGVGRFQLTGDNELLSLILLPFGMFRKEKPARVPRFGRENLGMMVE